MLRLASGAMAMLRPKTANTGPEAHADESKRLAVHATIADGWRTQFASEILSTSPFTPPSTPPPTSPSAREVPIDNSTHIPEELFNELMVAGREARRRGQHVDPKRRGRQERALLSERRDPTAPSKTLVMAGALVTR